MDYGYLWQLCYNGVHLDPYSDTCMRLAVLAERQELNALGLERLSDSEILQLAVDENRIVLTHDLDFGELVAASGSRIPSVVVFRLRRMQADRVSH